MGTVQLLLLATLAAVGGSVQSADISKQLDALSKLTSVNPGLKMRLSQTGLNYAASVAVDVLAPFVVQIKLSDREGSATVPVVRRVDYRINNIKVP